MFHTNMDPNSKVLMPDLLSGCALAIADVDDIEKVTVDNLVVFSVQPDCVRTKLTTFEIPKMMPACTGKKCVCAWFWLTNTGRANFFMTGFDCNVTMVNPAATSIAAPSDPVFCPGGNTTCVPTAGAKRPPGYHSSWSFNGGAQNDIFEAESRAESPYSPASRAKALFASNVSFKSSIAGKQRFAKVAAKFSSTVQTLSNTVTHRITSH
ncbi:hypothetical protein RQP46_003468 [Phenoliferia psychrophenolica]